MENEDPITRAEVEASMAGLMAALGMLSVTVSALTKILQEVGIVNPASWNRHFDAARLETLNRNLAAALEKMSRKSAIADILKDFEGPLQ